MVSALRSFHGNVNCSCVHVTTALHSTIPITASDVERVAIVLVSVGRKVSRVALLQFLCRHGRERKDAVDVPSNVMVIVVEHDKRVEIFAQLVRERRRHVVGNYVGRPFLLFNYYSFCLARLSIPNFPRVLRLNVRTTSESVLPYLNGASVQGAGLRVSNAFQRNGVRSYL